MLLLTFIHTINITSFLYTDRQIDNYGVICKVGTIMYFHLRLLLDTILTLS